MPANRSRTLEWRRCLKQVYERDGALEIAVACDYDEDAGGHHLIWRVRILQITNDAIIVEQPSALGRSIELQTGVELVAILAIGQNRWMFCTVNLESMDFAVNSIKRVPALRLSMPETVQRCQRRYYYRADTASLCLPKIEMWPLLDPKSILVAERANEIQFQRDQEDMTQETSSEPFTFDPELMMPDVGPKFPALLVNIGGGGLGLRIEPEFTQSLHRHKVFWLRFTLPPELDTPVCATAKLSHTHMESSHHVYAGMAFDFSFNPGHQKFVIDQICRYIAMQQRAQLMRTDGQFEHRKSA